jgi:hypothetical protein
MDELVYQQQPLPEIGSAADMHVASEPATSDTGAGVRLIEPAAGTTAAIVGSQPSRESAWRRAGREIVSGVQTLLSAAVYATLIVTFGFQVARVDGLSMAPTSWSTRWAIRDRATS